MCSCFNKEATCPYDLRDVRYLEYDPQDLTSLKSKLIDYVKECISTIPQDWNRNYRPSDWEGAYIKISSLEAPSLVQLGQPFEIRVTARNNGSAAKQGYFSVSFPDGVEGLSIESNLETKVGLKGDPWGGGNVSLSYPIAEGFLEGENGVWAPLKEYSIKIRAYAKRKGLLWYYVNASGVDAVLKEWQCDPRRRLLDIDQRNENVYCGVIDIY